MRTEGAGSSRFDLTPGAVGSGVAAAPAWEAERACEHARVLLASILARSGCDAAPLDAVLDALVQRRGFDGPAVVHWLLGWHPALPPGCRPLDVWRAGQLSDLLILTSAV